MKSLSRLTLHGYMHSSAMHNGRKRCFHSAQPRSSTRVAPTSGITNHNMSPDVRTIIFALPGRSSTSWLCPSWRSTAVTPAADDNSFLPRGRHPDPETLAGARHRRHIEVIVPTLALVLLQHVFRVLRARFWLPRSPTANPPPFLVGSGVRRSCW